MVSKIRKSVPEKIAFWIMAGMVGGVAAGIAHGFLYPEKSGTTIAVIAVFGIGAVLACVRYLLQRYQEKRTDHDNHDSGSNNAVDGSAE